MVRGALRAVLALQVVDAGSGALLTTFLGRVAKPSNPV